MYVLYILKNGIRNHLKFLVFKSEFIKPNPSKRFYIYDFHKFKLNNYALLDFPIDHISFIWDFLRVESIWFISIIPTNIFIFWSITLNSFNMFFIIFFILCLFVAFLIVFKISFIFCLILLLPFLLFSLFFFVIV